MQSRRLFCALGCLVLGCNDLAGIEDASPRGAAEGCTSHADCMQESDAELNPRACIEGECVPLYSKQCQQMLPVTQKLWLKNLKSPDVDPFIFGVFGVTDQLQIGFDADNYDLMLQEVTNGPLGLPTPSGSRRPLVAVLCNSGSAQKELTQAELYGEMDHLVGDLHVPAILSGLPATDLERAFRYRGQDDQVFFMNVYGAEANVQALQSGGLIWSMLPQGTKLLPAYQPLLDRTIARLRSSGTLGPSEHVRVAIVVAKNIRVLTDMGTELVSTLEFNGKTAAENDPADFTLLSVDSESGDAMPYASAAIDYLQYFKPHIVVSLTGNEFLGQFIPNLEATTPPFAPTYVLSLWDYSATDQLSTLVRTSYQNLYTRLVGVNYAAAADPKLYKKYQLDFNAAYPALMGLNGFENYYDGAYYLFYAAAASGQVANLTGPAFVDGMRRLLSGPAFDVGPEDLTSALHALGQTPAGGIQLNGTMGPPDFDPDTGVRSDDGTPWGSIYCIDAMGNRQSDVLTLDSSQTELVGHFPCFDGL